MLTAGNPPHDVFEPAIGVEGQGVPISGPPHADPAASRLLSALELNQPDVAGALRPLLDQTQEHI